MINKLKTFGTMERLIRQSIGIDVSKDLLDVVLSALNEDFQVRVLCSAQFDNSSKGITKLIKWVNKQRMDHLCLQVVLEATGIYHEEATYMLHDHDFQVAVVMPNKVKNYWRSTDVRTINDKISARQIAEFGLMKRLDNWQKPDECLRQLKGLSRERQQLIDERTRAKNQQHAKAASAIRSEATLDRSVKHIEFLADQIKEIEDEIKILIKNTPWLKNKIDNICSIRGVGLITAVTVIAETDGFNLIRNNSQLVCFAGYDVIHKQSGTSVNTKGKISHKGSKFIRKALYFPAIAAANDEAYFGNLYKRVYNKHNIKMKGYVAVQRKLLIMIYTLWKKDEKYKPEKHKSIKNLEQPAKAALTELDHVRSC